MRTGRTHGPNGSQALWSAVVSAALTLAYCVAKIELTIGGEMGIPGIPLSDPEKGRDNDLVWLRQLGNAAVGYGAAILALATLVSIPSRAVRFFTAGALWIGFAFMAAGAGGVLLRTVGLQDSLGDVPMTWASGLTNAVGICLTVSWLTMATLYTRHIGRLA